MIHVELQPKTYMKIHSIHDKCSINISKVRQIQLTPKSKKYRYIKQQTIRCFSSYVANHRHDNATRMWELLVDQPEPCQPGGCRGEERGERVGRITDSVQSGKCDSSPTQGLRRAALVCLSHCSLSPVVCCYLNEVCQGLNNSNSQSSQESSVLVIQGFSSEFCGEYATNC